MNHHKKSRSTKVAFFILASATWFLTGNHYRTNQRPEEHHKDLEYVSFPIARLYNAARILEPKMPSIPEVREISRSVIDPNNGALEENARSFCDLYLGEGNRIAVNFFQPREGTPYLIRVDQEGSSRNLYIDSLNKGKLHISIKDRGCNGLDSLDEVIFHGKGAPEAYGAIPEDRQTEVKEEYKKRLYNALQRLDLLVKTQKFISSPNLKTNSSIK